MLRIPISILQALNVKPAGRPAASRQMRDARHIQNYMVWRPDAKGLVAELKPTECFIIVWPIKHCHHSLQPIAPTQFAHIQPRPNVLWLGEDPTLNLLMKPPGTRFEVLLLEQAALGISQVLQYASICFICFNVLNTMGTMTSTSSARSIHSGKRSLPPPDAFCCCQNSVVLGDRSCPALGWLQLLLLLLTLPLATAAAAPTVPGVWVVVLCSCCCCSWSCPSCPCLGLGWKWNPTRGGASAMLLLPPPLMLLPLLPKPATW